MLSYELARRAIPQYFPRDWANAHDFDALLDWKSARLFLQGKSPYTAEGLAFLRQDGMGHPPTTPFWYLPLADFEKPVVAQLSAFLLLVLLPLHAFLCAKALKYPFPLATALLVSSAVTATSWLAYHFDAIQFSEPIAFLYVLRGSCSAKIATGSREFAWAQRSLSSCSRGCSCSCCWWLAAFARLRSRQARTSRSPPS